MNNVLIVNSTFDDVCDLLNYKKIIISVEETQLKLFEDFMEKAMISHTNRITEESKYYYIENCDVDSVDSEEELNYLLAEDCIVYNLEFIGDVMKLTQCISYKQGFNS